MRDEFIGYFDDDNGAYVPVVDMGQLIVRCADCKLCVENDSFYDCEYFDSHLCWNEGQAPDGFCAWGERRCE